MSVNDWDPIKFLEYINKRLPPEECEKFEFDLKNDPQMREALMFFLDIYPMVTIIDRIDSAHIESDLLAQYIVDKSRLDTVSIHSIERHLKLCRECSDMAKEMAIAQTDKYARWVVEDLCIDITHRVEENCDYRIEFCDQKDQLIFCYTGNSEKELHKIELPSDTKHVIHLLRITECPKKAKGIARDRFILECIIWVNIQPGIRPASGDLSILP